MIADEGFHLTPLDVRRYEFGRSLRGYDPERVEQFRTQVADELERLTRLNQELETKSRGFHEQLRAFRERDKAINDALVSAQQLRSEIRDQAEREGSLMMRELQAQGERELEAARAEVRRMEETLATLDRTRRSYLAQLRVLCERQLAEIAAAESQPTPTLTSGGLASAGTGNLPSTPAYGHPTAPAGSEMDEAAIRREIERDFGGTG